MSSAALDAALADIDTVFNGFAGFGETGCDHCRAPEETVYLRTPHGRWRTAVSVPSVTWATG